MKVLYLTTQDSIADRLKKQFTDVDWISFIAGMSDFSDLEAILICEPYECLYNEKYNENKIDVEPGRGGPYMSIFKLWRRFLEYHCPDIKLLIAGFDQGTHPNYLNLVALSPQIELQTIINGALPVTEDWEDQIPCRGFDILERLKIFFEGHNKEGIIMTVSRVRQSLNHAYYDRGIREASQDEFNVVWQNVLLPERNSVRLMLLRWQNYAPYFACCPFFFKLKVAKMDQYMKDLNHIMDGKRGLKKEAYELKQEAFINFDGYNRLDRIQQVLDNINKRYINPEIVGTILVIDNDPSFHTRLDNSFPTFKLDHVYTGEEGVERATQKQFDMILLDLELEDGKLTGLNFIKILKKISPKTPIVVATTHGKDETQKEALRLGADDFLAKHEYDLRLWERLFIRMISKTDEQGQEKILRQDITLEDQAQVLVIEDDDKWFERIGVLNGKKMKLHRAASTQEAIDIIKDEKYDFDLILLDLYLDERDNKATGGLEMIPFIAKLRPITPIIVVTRELSYSMTINAIEKGANDYLRKDRFNARLWGNRFEQYIKLKKLRETPDKTLND